MVKPGYKQTEIGVIPEDWEVVRIKNIATPKARIGWQNLRKEEYLKSGEYLLITGTDFSNGRILFDKCCYVSRERYVQDKNIQITNGTILITKDGTLGKVAFVQGLKKPSTLNAGIFVLNKLDGSIYSYFLYQYLRTDALVEYALKTSTGGTIQHLNQNVLANFFIPQPPLAEQKRIADALSDMDSMISSLEKLIEKKKSVKQGTMQELLTGKKRLPGFTGEWGYKEMKHYLHFQVGYPFHSAFFNTEGCGLRLVKNRDLKTDDQVYYTTEICSRDYIVRNGDVLIGMDGDFLPYLWKKGQALLNQRVGRIKSNAYMDLMFAYYCLQKPLEELQEGTGATTVKHLSHADIVKLKIKIPSDVSEQSAIASILSDMDDEIEALEQKLAKTRQLKQGMMQQLLTGKIRLV